MRIFKEAREVVLCALRSSRKAWLALVLALIVGVVGLVVWRALRTPEDAVWQRIQDTGIWRVGMDPSFPPFESLDGAGQPVGIDVDLARAIAAQWDVEVSLAGVGFDGLLPALWADKVDAIVSSLPVDPRMARDIAYSIPYLDAGLVLVVSGDDSEISTMDDLRGKRLAVEWGSEGDVQAREMRGRLRDLTIVPLPDAAAALNSLQAEEADAVLVDYVSFRQVSAEQPDLRTVGDAVVSVPYVIAISVEAPLLLEAVNEALVHLKEHGELDRLVQVWF
jgi:ABC-type amino acid transport substrate-binding protein